MMCAIRSNIFGRFMSVSSVCANVGLSYAQYTRISPVANNDRATCARCRVFVCEKWFFLFFF